MYLSVIIPTCNRNDLLMNCLELLSPSFQSIDKQFYEVIVTDDSPGNIAKDLSGNFPWVKFIEGPRRGPASNRNHGAKFAEGDWLVFIDDDCLPDKDILSTYYNEIIIGKYKAIEGLIDAERPRERFDEESPLNLKGGCFWSCNIAVEKSLFTGLNGFDEGFPYPAMEDVDFFSRLKVRAEHTFLPAAKVIHPWRIVRPFQNFRKRIISNRYSLNKDNVKRGLSYKFKRLKLFAGLIIDDTRLLMKCSFKGIGVYFDRFCFQVVMLFI